MSKKAYKKLEDGQDDSGPLLAPQPQLAESEYVPPTMYPPPTSPGLDAKDMKIASPNLGPGADDVNEDRATMRTPSPTPEEAKLLMMRGFTDWQEAKNWRWWVRKDMIKTYFITAFILAAVILVSVYEKPIVRALRPLGHTLRSMEAVGWLVPVAVLYVLSFPPLFGQEVVHIFCGLIWGPWIGFSLVVAGSVLGELTVFYVYKYWCFERSQKLEKTNIQHACFVHATKEGGWFLATVARWSFLPTHFTTAVFSACGMSLGVFLIATILSLPQLLVNVYSGYVMALDGSSHPSQLSDIMVWVLFGVTTVLTAVAAYYISRQTDKAKKPVIYARRKARQIQKQLLA